LARTWAYQSYDRGALTDGEWKIGANGMSLLRRFAIEVTSICLVVACIVTVQCAPLDPNAFTSLGTLDVSAGTLTINTDTLAISGAAAFTGIATPQSGGSEIAVFTFDNIDVDAAVTVTFSGSRPVALLSQENATIAATLNVNGGAGGGNGSNTNGAAGPAGGARGGGGSGGPMGPGAGVGGGGFGGAGGHHGATTPFGGGPAYGDLGNILQGGSGGGGFGQGQPNGGGGGAGAVEIGALGILSIGTVNANGGAGGGTFPSVNAGSGGSGGAVLLHGELVSFGAVVIRGGNGGGATYGGGGGGGGRLRVVTGGTYMLGQAPPSGLSAAGGTGGVTSSGSGVSGLPGSAGVAELVPALTVIPAGMARQLDGSATFSEPITNGWTLRATSLQVNAGAVASSAVPINTTHDLVLNGGFVAAGQGWQLNATAEINGFGQLSGAVMGGATNHVAASGGTLTLGDANSNEGFSFAGAVDVASGTTLNLLDANAAELGAATTLADGARLNSLNGIRLSAGEIVTASAAAGIAGKFTNQGTVNGPTAAGQFLTFTDDVDGAGSYTGNVLFSDGFSPGNSPAAVSLENAAFDSSAELRIELGGLLAGTEHDRLNVSGTASLDGTLQIQLINGFDPNVGDSFDILNWGSLSGTFDTLNLPALSDLQWDTSRLYTAGILSVTLPGDFNGNGIVDAVDYVVWRKGLGTTYTQNDYNVWRAHFGQTAGAGAGSGVTTGLPDSAVPEPAGFMLTLVAGIMVVAASRR
jgi:hypothetical protein